MDKIIKKISGFGVPGLIFLVAIQFTGLAGAAALTAALSAIGPGGIVGGVLTLIFLGSVAESITEFGFDAIAKGVIKELYCKGESKDSLKKKVEKYPISSKLKNNLYYVIENFS